VNLPFFYISGYDVSQQDLVLDENTSRHIVTVLRMGKGERIRLTDGQGSLLTAEIIQDHKKHCSVTLLQRDFIEPAPEQITIALSLIKNTARLEWFVEKAAEMGVAVIIPMICERTEKQHFRLERMQGILVSAMLQSQQCWLPVLHNPTAFEQIVQTASQQQKFIAHCLPDEKRNLQDLINEALQTKIILIGPEGDFTKEEVDLAVRHHFSPVALGTTRLRTETAGLVAATLLRHV
jgi:16S rRNA (uracil1498-N3)-methyltransferase